jgi:hypothetical protein
MILTGAEEMNAIGLDVEKFPKRQALENMAEIWL